MTQTQKKKYRAKMRIACADALLELAHQQKLNVTQVGDQLNIVGPNGYISDYPHGDSHHEGFIPGSGTEEDWERFFADGVSLSYVHKCEGMTFADNFNPKDAKDVADIFANLRITTL